MNGHFTPAEAAFLYTNGTGHTTYDHAYIDGSITGDLFKLPAGPLGAAFGFEVRDEALDDTPAPDFIASNVYNFSTTGITKGSETTEEMYGELQIPIIKNVPLIQSFDASNLSARFSNTTSYGSTVTYKGTADWKVTDWLAFRGTYGTGFRAPALYELFLADQTSFAGQLGLDPCIEYGTSGVSRQIKTNCASLRYRTDVQRLRRKRRGSRGRRRRPPEGGDLDLRHDRLRPVAEVLGSRPQHRGRLLHLRYRQPDPAVRRQQHRLPVHGSDQLPGQPVLLAVHPQQCVRRQPDSRSTRSTTTSSTARKSTRASTPSTSATARTCRRTSS